MTMNSGVYVLSSDIVLRRFFSYTEHHSRHTQIAFLLHEH